MSLPRRLQGFFTDPLSNRLVLSLVACAALSAALAMIAMVATAWLSAEEQAHDDAQQTARSLALSLSAPLAFSDVDGVRESLSILSTRKNVTAAWVLDAAGNILQTYGTASGRQPDPDGGGVRQGFLIVSTPVLAGIGKDRMGSVTLKLNLQAYQDDLRQQAMVAALGALIALLLTASLAQRLARQISVPIVQLAAAAKRLTADWRLPEPLPVSGSDEVAVAIAAFNRMVTELGRRDRALKQLNEQLRQAAHDADLARKQAEAASVAKTRFLANMSHELRSPLNGVIGAAQLLEGASVDAARRTELVKIIRTSGNNLLDLIESVLDVSRIEAGKVRIERQAFNLLQCIESALAPAGVVASLKGLQLHCYIDPAVPQWCEGDGARVKQLVQNLLGNAVKFTERGHVSLDVEPERGSSRICFHVTDTGIGLPSDQLESVFEPFRQGDSTSTRRFGGSGLGLTICREIARLMGGDVRVISEVNKGSRFTLLVPLPRVDGSARSLVPVRTQLICFEPERSSRRGLEALLTRIGCSSVYVDSVESLRPALAARTGEPEVVVLLATDHPLSEDMYTVVRAQHRSAVIIGIGSGSSRTLHLPETVSRPVSISVLHGLLHGRVRAGSSGLTGIHATMSPVARVLVVEDDEVNRVIVRSMVECGGFQCVAASNATEALRRLADEHFDAVLMDWQMPGMDGLEATRRLRAGMAGSLNRAVPVIALTANAFAEDKDACLAAGMSDFLTKPVQTSTLITTLQRWCWGQMADSATVEIDSQDSAAADAPAFDPAVLGGLPMVADGSSPGYVRELLTRFAQSTQRSLDTLDQYMDARNVLAVQRIAHTLKSSAAQIGALALASEAAAIEQDLRSGGDCGPDCSLRLRRRFRKFLESALPDMADATA
jgi:signal transduction histidine kinase/CheY-like chemotaxis protein/HPt (histidine-containing phosphotransfer) domain-containing protein